MRTAVVLFTRDLRVHDNAALAAAAREAERVVPLFVLDRAIAAAGFAVPNRADFLAASLRDLDASLRRRGGNLVVRRGDVVTETLRVADVTGAEAVFVMADASRYARSREAALARACAETRRELRLAPGVSAVPLGTLRPASGDHYRVYTPFWRVWSRHVDRPGHPAPARVTVPEGLDAGALPTGAEIAPGARAPELAPGGEGVGRARLADWIADGLADYPEHHDDLPGDRTSRLAAYIHFGCVSAGDAVRAALGRPGGEDFARQLCWRDFHTQVLAAFPELPRRDYRPRGDGAGGGRDEERLAAWREGRTGVPIVDAGMRQLRREGFMHNRARLITSSYLVKQLEIDWRPGADHFLALLTCGDLANNSGNWQWVAGTGNDTRPYRRFNPLRQAARFDPEGDYVRRYVPELRPLAGAAAHRPWRLTAAERRLVDYPAPLTEVD